MEDSQRYFTKHDSVQAVEIACIPCWSTTTYYPVRIFLRRQKRVEKITGTAKW